MLMNQQYMLNKVSSNKKKTHIKPGYVLIIYDENVMYDQRFKGT